jgi:hypothetical protein
LVSLRNTSKALVIFKDGEDMFLDGTGFRDLVFCGFIKEKEYLHS